MNSNTCDYCGAPLPVVAPNQDNKTVRRIRSAHFQACKERLLVEIDPSKELSSKQELLNRVLATEHRLENIESRLRLLELAKYNVYGLGGK